MTSAVMDDSEIASIIQQKLVTSLGYMGGLLSQDRLKAYKYYMGEPFGDEEDGKSKVVSRVVAETIDGMIPPLLKPFTASEQLASFDPVYKVPRPGETVTAAAQRAEAEAKQATDLVNHDFFKRNAGFAILHNWIKDALLQKNGIVKSWWDDKIDLTKETYEGLDDAGLQMLRLDDEVEIIKLKSYPDPVAEKSLVSMLMARVQQPMLGGMTPQPAAPGAPNAPATPQPPAMPSAPQPPMPTPPQPMGGMQPSLTPQPMGMPAPFQIPMLHDVTCRRTRRSAHVAIRNVPADEFLVDRRAVSLDEAPFLCHRAKYTVSDIKEMFPEVDASLIENLPGNDAVGDFNQERLQRFKDEDAYPYRQDIVSDKSMREIWLNECYIKLDVLGEGVAQLWQVFLGGDAEAQIICKQEVDSHPFSAWTAIPMPHKFYGMSIADQTMDLQEISSVLFRGALNSVYLGNEPMIGTVDGEVNLDDLMNRRAGGIVRMKSADSIFDIPHTDVSSSAFNMLGFLDSVKESRTGVKRFSSTMQADAITPYAETATGVASMDQAANDRLECIAKIFAETGIKPLVKRLLELHCKHSEQATMIRMAGKYVEMDPRQWSTQMDATVHTGLGTASHNARLARLMALLPLYQILAPSPLVQPANTYAYLTEILRASELSPAEKFFTDPGNMAKPQPGPDPKAAAETAQVQAKTQLAQQDAKFKMQLEQQKLENAKAAQAAQTQDDITSQHARTQSDIAIEQQKLVMEGQLARQKMAMDMQIESLKANHAMELERQRTAHDMAVQRMLADNKAQIDRTSNPSE